VRRSPRVILTWLAALVVALTTTIVVSGDLASLHRRAASLGPLHGVIVAARDLSIGQTVRAADLHRESRYASEIPRDAISDSRSAVGRVVIVPVLRDAVVFTRHLAPANRAGLDGVVPVGDRAVHVSPKDGFRPPPGAIVDVLAAFDPTAVTVVGGTDEAVVVAAGARVLATDATPTDPSSASSTAGVTLLVTEAEARAIAFAEANGDLTLAVAPPESAPGARPSS
jgi:Flp pilus assembly protein CpaB